MQVLSIFKFRLPCIESRYEEVIFHDICSDIERLCKYEGIYVKTQKTSRKNYILKTIYFVGGRYDIFFYEGEEYFIPVFQLDLIFDLEISSKVTKKLVQIMRPHKLQKYIFDITPELAQLVSDKNIISPESLSRNFGEFGTRDLYSFMKKTQRKYLSETLKNSIQVQESLYYMLYICYQYYRIYEASEKELGNIGELQRENNDISHRAVLELSGKRLQHVHDIHIVNFQRYSEMLEEFFSLLKST